MSVRLHHTLVIERPTAGARDDYGNPSQTWATLATVKGLVQPKNVRDLAPLSQGGPVVSDMNIYLYPTDLAEADRIVSDGLTYQVDGVHDEGGADHHFRVDAHLVQDAA